MSAKSKKPEAKTRFLSDGFPELNELNILEFPEEKPVFQLFLSRILEGSAVWIDVGNQASTYALASIGSKELLENVSIGRAFTAFQHHSLLQDIEEFTDESTQVIVLPSIDRLYIDGQISDKEAEELFSEVVDKIDKLRSKYTVLISLDDRSFCWRLEGMGKRIDIEETVQGLNIGGEKLFYAKGRMVQTTLGYWENQGIEFEGETEWEEQTPHTATI